MNNAHPIEKAKKLSDSWTLGGGLRIWAFFYGRKRSARANNLIKYAEAHPLYTSQIRKPDWWEDTQWKGAVGVLIERKK
jgi:hypothetical protein